MRKQSAPKSAITAGYIISAALILIAIGILGYIGWWHLIREPDTSWGYRYASRFDIWHWAIPGALGAIIMIWSSYQYQYWYGTVVGNAIVVNKRHIPIYSFDADRIELLLTGKNRAGQPLTVWTQVTIDTWASKNIGDEIRM